MEFFTNLYQLSDWGLLALRIAIGSIFLVHGAKKWAMWKMQPSEQMPAGMLKTMRFLSIVEPIGGLAVLLGFLTPIAAVGLGIIMIGAIWFKVSGMKKTFTGDGGWEYDFLILAVTIALVFIGAGVFSLDRALFGL